MELGETRRSGRAPILTHYKRSFAWRRWLTSLSGTPWASPSVALTVRAAHQVVVLVPLVVGIVSVTALSHSFPLAVAVAVTAVAVWLGALHWVRQRSTAAVHPVGTVGISLLDDDEPAVTRLCSAEAIGWLVPQRRWCTWAGHVTVAVAVEAMAVTWAHPRHWPVMWRGAAGWLAVNGVWLTVAAALWPVTATERAEPAALAGHSPAALKGSRAAVTVTLLAVAIACRHLGTAWEGSEAVEWTVAVMLWSLPCLWSVAVVPPLDAAVEWLAEVTMEWLGGGFPMASQWRSVVALPLSLLPAASVRNVTLLTTVGGNVVAGPTFGGCRHCSIRQLDSFNELVRRCKRKLLQMLAQVEVASDQWRSNLGSGSNLVCCYVISTRQ